MRAGGPLHPQQGGDPHQQGAHWPLQRRRPSCSKPAWPTDRKIKENVIPIIQIPRIIHHHHSQHQSNRIPGCVDGPENWRTQTI